ncbi:MAG: hypothetical protein ABI168_02410 [Ginsengibacter sp.]
MNRHKNVHFEVPLIPIDSYHSILHYLALEKIHRNRIGSSSSFGNKRHPHFIFQYHKNFRLLSRLRGSALCLLKTQFAKKPKNPV